MTDQRPADVMDLNDFWGAVNGRHARNRALRWGQAVHTVLAELRPDLAERIAGDPELDPFNVADEHDPVYRAFVTYVERHWSTADGES